VRGSRGMSVIEVTVAVLIVTVLSAVMVNRFTTTTNTTVDSTSERLLVGVASAQESYHRSRGQFASSTDALERLSTPSVTLTVGASTGPAVVSVVEVSYLGETLLGIATLSGSGNCVTLLVPEPGSSQSFEAVSTKRGGSCDGSKAAPS
jgi:Tfp pilus assembly protein PilE